MGKEGFKDLIVWQKGKDLAVTTYRITEVGPFGRDFGLRDQMRRCAVSFPSNIAEGDERDTDKKSIRFFYIAKGSLAELRTQVVIAHEIGYLEKEVFEVFEEIEEECVALGKMIGGLIKSRQRAIPDRRRHVS